MLWVFIQIHFNVYAQEAAGDEDDEEEEEEEEEGDDSMQITGGQPGASPVKRHNADAIGGQSLSQRNYRPPTPIRTPSATSPPPSSSIVSPGSASAPSGSFSPSQAILGRSHTGPTRIKVIPTVTAESHPRVVKV